MLLEGYMVLTMGLMKKLGEQRSKEMVPVKRITVFNSSEFRHKNQVCCPVTTVKRRMVPYKMKMHQIAVKRWNSTLYTWLLRLTPKISALNSGRSLSIVIK